MVYPPVVSLEWAFSRVRMLLCCALVLSGGCLSAPRGVPGSFSVGTTSAGLIHGGVALADRGEGFVRARPGEATRFGTRRLVGALTRAASAVQRRFPGAAPLRVGDLSGPRGGRHPRHGSHRSGRDADVIFYLEDGEGVSVRGRGWLAFDASGVARETIAVGGGRPSQSLFYFDDAKNWTFVRTLLADGEGLVQWIFCSNAVKGRLLRYAAEFEQDPAVLYRARWVLHQPSRGHPHDDHFHIRVACGPEEQAHGCINRGPYWSWLRPKLEKSIDAQTPLSDEVLLEAILRPIERGTQSM